MTANIIYERIKEQADKQNLSLRQLSIKSGFKSPSAISRYKQGVTPTDTAVKAIAGALGVSVDYLLGNTDDMHTNKKDESTVDLIAAHWGVDLDNLSKEEKAIVMARARDYVKGLVDAFESK